MNFCMSFNISITRVHFNSPLNGFRLFYLPLLIFEKRAPRCQRCRSHKNKYSILIIISPIVFCLKSPKELIKVPQSYTHTHTTLLLDSRWARNPGLGQICVNTPFNFIYNTRLFTKEFKNKKIRSYNIKVNVYNIFYYIKIFV